MAPADEELPLDACPWQPSHRLIASRYPTVGLYDAITDPADLDVIYAIEGLTNPRLRDELGQLSLVPAAERISGPGSTPVMAAFTHLNPDGSRFSDGSYGVYYAADSLATALAEVGHHRARFLVRTAEPPIDVDLRQILAEVAQPLHSLVGHRQRLPALYDALHYGAAQAFGARLRAAGSWGLRYHSVRREEGECIAVFRPRALRRVRIGAHLALHWDGQRITHWYEKREPRPLE